MALHVVFAAATAAGCVVVVGLAILSSILGWQSKGRRDHRSALDRAVLVVLGAVILCGSVGILLIIAGSQPRDPLHYVYGPAALIALPFAIWIGARSASTDSFRLRRDLWTAGGGTVLLGIVLRLYATG